MLEDADLDIDCLLFFGVQFFLTVFFILLKLFDDLFVLFFVVGGGVGGELLFGLLLY